MAPFTGLVDGVSPTREKAAHHGGGGGGAGGLDGIKGLLRVESALTPILHTNQEQTLFFIEITGIFVTEIYYTILT